MPLSRTRWLTPAALFFLTPLPGAAQGIPFSQRASVSQTVAFTHISIDYGRPTARGRQIFGDSGIVKWDRIWHPGADSATRIAFDHDVTLEGTTLRAGEYTLWTIPRESGRWTVIVSRAAHVFHTPYPGESQRRDAGGGAGGDGTAHGVARLLLPRRPPGPGDAPPALG